MFVYACVCACVRVRVRACACVCVHACMRACACFGAGFGHDVTRLWSFYPALTSVVSFIVCSALRWFGVFSAAGKVMRRILRKIASKEEGSLGDTSTLADPTVIDTIIENRVH